MEIKLTEITQKNNINFDKFKYGVCTNIAYIYHCIYNMIGATDEIKSNNHLLVEMLHNKDWNVFFGEDDYTTRNIKFCYTVIENTVYMVIAVVDDFDDVVYLINNNGVCNFLTSIPGNILYTDINDIKLAETKETEYEKYLIESFNNFV